MAPSLRLSLIEADPDLPRGIRIEHGGVLVLPDRELTLEPHSWLLPPLTAEYVEEVLYHYLGMPALFLAHEDRINTYWRTVLHTTVEAARADERATIAEQDQRWPTWLWVVTVGAVAVTMGMVGFIVGVVMK